MARTGENPYLCRVLSLPFPWSSFMLISIPVAILIDRGVMVHLIPVVYRYYVEAESFPLTRTRNQRKHFLHRGKSLWSTSGCARCPGGCSSRCTRCAVLDAQVRYEVNDTVPFNSHRCIYCPGSFSGFGLPRARYG